MALKTATNPTTGESVVQVDGAWQPITQSATNPEGVKAYLVGGKWLTDTEGPATGQPKRDALISQIPSYHVASDGAIKGSPSGAPVAPIEEKSSIQRAVETGLDVGLPTIGALVGGAGGTLLRQPFAGASLGAGLGTAAAGEAKKLLENVLGQRQSQGVAQESLDAAKNTLIGAAFESGGRVILPAAAKAAGWLYDGVTGRLAQIKGGKIVQELAGPQLEALKAASAANPNAPAAQAVAGVYAPPIQTLGKRAVEKAPYTHGPIAAEEQAAAQAQLEELAGGASQTEAKVAQNAARLGLNKQLIPVLENNLNTANIAGRELPRLQGEADRLAAAAGNKVEDVRRFTAAGERAGERAANTYPVVGQPRVPGRYTYMGELEKKAEQVAETAARGSLTFGEAGRFAQAAADSLAAHGLAPLETAPVIASILGRAKDPAHAGNNLLESTLANVANDIAKWTNNGGVIDARALDSIRKNSVNSAVQRLLPGSDEAAQQKAAAGVMAEVKPMIVKAIEDAGGKGYGQYLADYSAGRQLIDQQKLGATALDLFKNSPKEFVSLVEGNSPKAVEKIFGPGSYNIAKEMSAQAMETLRGVANQVSRTAEMAKQAKAGSVAYEDAIRRSAEGMPRINMLSRKATLANEAVDILESKLNKKVMNELVKGMESGRTLNELLNIVPSSQRNTVLNALQKIGGSPSGAIFMTSPNQNNLGAQQ